MRFNGNWSANLRQEPLDCASSSSYGLEVPTTTTKLQSARIAESSRVHESIEREMTEIRHGLVAMIDPLLDALVTLHNEVDDLRQQLAALTAPANTTPGQQAD